MPDLFAVTEKGTLPIQPFTYNRGVTAPGPNSKFKLSTDVLYQDVGGEVVILDLASENYFGLDEVGARIWQLIGDGLDMGGIRDALLDEYDVDRETLEDDIERLVGELEQAGLIEPSM